MTLHFPILRIWPPEATATVHVDSRLLRTSDLPRRLPVLRTEVALLRAMLGADLNALLWPEDGEPS